MTQVCINLWLGELFMSVFMYFYSSGLQKLWSAGHQLMRIFFSSIFENFFGFKSFKLRTVEAKKSANNAFLLQEG